MDDRRRFQRARIPGIHGSQNLPGDIRVLDLSLGGMAMETRAELEPGQRCFLELRHENHTVSVEAEVRWSSAFRVEREPDALRPVFRVGVSFVDIVRDGPGGIWDWLLVEDPEDATEH